MFLVQVMGFGWEEVHEIAEEMEHFTKDIFFDRMDEILAFPTADPHGSPILTKDGLTIERNDVPLSNINTGQSAILKAE